MIGQTLSHYKITSALGAGGMGEVYRATDTKLGRDVALKVLPAALAQDPERLSRFEREARLLAALNHANIAHVYGFESATLDDGTKAHFLAMELVEGEDLAERLRRGPVPVGEALAVARQIAEALEAAHEKGIVHRDLKPANVKLTPEGKVKVLDFGLAKAHAGDSAVGSSADLSQSPTLAQTGTQAGVILGTASYMSPEQARGRRVDKRTDIWAFGALLFELLTGGRAFAGETVTDVLAAVVQNDPPWERLPAEAPAGVRRLLRRCLRKNADERLHDIADARLEIDEALRAPGGGLDDASTPGTPRGLPRRLLLVALATAAGLAGVSIGAAWSRRAAPAPAEPVLRLSITGLGWSDVEVIDVTLMQNLMTLSPDGSRLVYSAVRDGTRRLYLRELDAFDAQAIKGTENGFGPFLSPDGASLAFAADGRLKKVSLAGGLPEAFAAAPALRGGAWRADGTVFFTPLEFSGLWRTSVAGGDRQSLGGPDSASGELVRCLPKLLPGGESLLYTAFLGGKAARVGLYDTATGQSRVLVEDANNAHYLRSGHLVFGRGNEIWAAAFDLARSEIVGTPQRMVEGVWAGGFFYATLFDASENGVLAYAPAGAHSGGRSLVWVDREGETPLTREARAYAAPRLSPDGTSILVRIAEDTTDIWSYEIERGALTRLTSDGYEDGPLWTADGKAILYESNKSGVRAPYRQPVAAKGEAVQLGQGGRTFHFETLSKDGKTIVAIEMNPKTGLDLFLIPLDANTRPVPLLVTDSSEYSADLSPDGKWFVYVSRASGRPEIGVRSVAGGGDESRVSLNGGTEPRWSRDGREIFFREGQKMMVAEVATEPTVSISKPRTLFEGLYEVMDGPINYDVTPDGRRFLMVKMERSEAPTELRVVTGWGRELRKTLPSGGDRP